MFPERSFHPVRRQRGFGVVAAIVVLVMLAGLAAYIVTISSTQHMGVALDIQGGRALQAARAGMDWGIARAISAPTNFDGTGSNINCRTGAVTVNLSTGAGGDLAAYNGLTVSVSCKSTAYTDGADLISYSLVATACNQPSGGACPNTSNPGSEYVERRVSTQLVCNATGTC